MPLITTQAIVLSAMRYGETSKIVRLATREHGVQSAIAKGALRPRSGFGASLQPLSRGTSHYLSKEHRELHILTGFELLELHAGLAGQVERYAGALVLAELMLRMAPAAAHAESFDTFAHQLGMLEAVPAEAVASYALRAIWTQVAVLGFAPAVDACAMDGRAVTGDTIPFSIADGGIICSFCAVGRNAIALPRSAREELAAFLDPGLDMPILDARHAAAHRRLVGRWIRFHAGESPELSALTFWEGASSRPVPLTDVRG